MVYMVDMVDLIDSDDGWPRTPDPTPSTLRQDCCTTEGQIENNRKKEKKAMVARKFP